MPLPNVLPTTTVLVLISLAQALMTVAVAVYFWSQNSDLRLSLTSVQQAVDRCHTERAKDQREIGELRATVAALERELKQYVNATPCPICRQQQGGAHAG